MCDQQNGSCFPPLNLTGNEVSILKILRSLQARTGKCVKKEWRTETGTGNGQSNTCFQFCKHCIAQLDSVIAANQVSTSLPSAMCPVIPNSNVRLTEICDDHNYHYNYNLSSSGTGTSTGSGSISSQECTESNNRLSMFLKLVSAALSSNSLTEVDTSTNNASLCIHGTDVNNPTVISSTSTTAIADQIVTEQIVQGTIFDATSTYTDNRTAADAEIEEGFQLPFVTSTSSSPEAVLHHQYNACDNTTIYTFEALVPEPRSFILRNNKNGTEIVTATASDTGTGTGTGLGNVQLLCPVSPSAPGRGPGSVLSCQPNLILTLEQSGLENIFENVDGRNSNQNQSSFDAGLPFLGQEVEVSSLGQTASAPQYQLPPLSVGSLVQKRSKATKRKLASSVEQPPITLINFISPGSVNVKEGHCKRDKKPSKSTTIYHVVSRKLPQNNTYSCPSCTSTFPSKYALDNHRKDQHKACICGQTYSQAKDLSEHKLICAFLKTKKHYSCSICLKEYLSREGVKRHEQTHSGIKTHKCDKCGHSFYGRSELSKHQKSNANSDLCVGTVRGRNKANSTSRAGNDAGTGIVVDPTSTVNGSNGDCSASATVRSNTHPELVN